MGEAKRRKRMREATNQFSKPLKRARFYIYTIGTRHSIVPYMCEELSWWASLDERLISMSARDLTDNDYLWVILARDRHGCFRCAKVQSGYATQWHAEEALRFAIADVMQNEDIDAFGDQGGETNAPVDLLGLPTDCDPETLHPYFRLLFEDQARAPGRAVIREIGPWLNPRAFSR